MRRKQRTSIYLDEIDIGRVHKTLGALNKLASSPPEAFVNGTLSLYNGTDVVPVGDIFYHAPVESYVIEWRQQ